MKSVYTTTVKSLEWLRQIVGLATILMLILLNWKLECRTFTFNNYFLHCGITIFIQVKKKNTVYISEYWVPHRHELCPPRRCSWIREITGSREIWRIRLCWHIWRHTDLSVTFSTASSLKWRWTTALPRVRLCAGSSNGTCCSWWVLVTQNDRLLCKYNAASSYNTNA